MLDAPVGPGGEESEDAVSRARLPAFLGAVADAVKGRDVRRKLDLVDA